MSGLGGAQIYGYADANAVSDLEHVSVDAESPVGQKEGEVSEL